MSFFGKSVILLNAVIFMFNHSTGVPLKDDSVLIYDGTRYSDDDTDVVEANVLKNIASADVIDLSFYGKAIYGVPDNAITAQMVAKFSPESSAVNPEELGTYLEGDILMPTNDAFLTKNGVTTYSSRWLGGVVPFEVKGNFGAQDLATIQRAIEEYHRRTCIRFVPRIAEPDFISIVNGNSGCWSSVGRVGGRQELNLQSPGCLTKPGTAIHELMHALGFLHEQNRQERDSFVSIVYENIQPSAMTNFERATRTNAYGVPYDYASVMHYSANAFSNNGQPTIVAMQPGGSEMMGQRDGFSPSDIEKLNKMYECGGLGWNAGTPSPPMTFHGPNGGNNNVINSFLGGLINGLGLGDYTKTIKAPSV